MYKVVSLFAGVGGIDKGFESTGKFKTVWANEYDNKAQETYKLNNNSFLNTDDIRNVKASEIPDMDILLSGFPCTSFSIAGYRKGFEDENTGDLFFETLRIIKEKKPKVIFLENVKNLVSHDKGKTFKIITDALEQNGYNIKYEVLNAKDYGNIPQNRERIYIVGFRDNKYLKNFNFPFPIKLTTKIKDILLKNIDDEKYFYSKDKNVFFDDLHESITKENVIYQWRRKYVRENKSGVCPTLTANMGTGGHNVPLVLQNNRIRKLTPKECFMFQGFPDNFVLPNEANSHLYKQAGNSVVVPVIARIANSIYDALSLNNNDFNERIGKFLKEDGINSFDEFINIWNQRKEGQQNLF